MAFATKLKELREAANLTQSELADKAGMSRRGISHLEQGLREPAWGTLQKLAAAFCVGVEVFAEPTTTPDRQIGRGRPRKARSETDEKPKEKRPRGRPKKS